MTDYIKRSDASRAMAKHMMDTALIDNPEASDRIEQWEGSIAAPVMSTVKAADVVEVVRCKDCIHYNEYASGEKIIDEEEVCDGWCMRWSGIENVNRHDYCSYGEEKHD